MPSSEERQHPPCEVIIVGGGISALIAARELLAAGSRVDIYERRQRRWLGGQCLDAFGGMLFVNSPEQRRVGIRDSLQLAWEDWQSYAELGPESEHQRAWARRYLERCLPVANRAERSREGRGNRVSRFHLLWGCGPSLVGSMLRELAPYEGSRLQIRCEHRVDQLIIE